MLRERTIIIIVRLVGDENHITVPVRGMLKVIEDTKEATRVLETEVIQ